MNCQKKKEKEKTYFIVIVNFYNLKRKGYYVLVELQEMWKVLNLNLSLDIKHKFEIKNFTPKDWRLNIYLKLEFICKYISQNKQ